MPRIIKIPLNIIRHRGGELDINNKYVDLPPEIIKDVLFSVQPSMGEHQRVLPDGINADDTRVLYSDFAVKQVDRNNQLKADRVEIEKYTYVAYKVRNWSMHGSRADHYESLFIREDVVSQFDLGI